MTFVFDPRGNRLMDWELRGEVELCIRADVSVYRHVATFLAAQGIVTKPTPFPEHEADRWTHCMTLSRAAHGLDDFMHLLSRVLILKNLPSEIDDAIALDFYTIPRPNTDPASWPHTEVGDLLNRMKYWKSDPLSQRTARLELADRLASVIDAHPRFRESVLVATPGHSGLDVAQSILLATDVGRALGANVVRPRARTLVRPEMKAHGVRVDLRQEFSTDPDHVAFRDAVVIDDVLSRGGTMQGVAAAVRRAGGRAVHGLVAARTIR